MNKKLLFIGIIIIISIFIISGIIFYILPKNDYSNNMIIKTEKLYYNVNKYGNSKNTDNKINTIYTIYTKSYLSVKDLKYQ